MKLKPPAYAIAAVALALTASVPARADYALIQFDDARCEVWSNSADNPGGAGWTKLLVGIPDWDSAEAAYHSARAQGICH